MRPPRNHFSARLGLALGCAATFGASARAEADGGPESLSLRQTIEKAVAGNNDLRRERINIDTANAGFLAAGGQFDFGLTGGLAFSRSTTPPISSNGRDFASGVTNQLNYNAGIARALETGGSLSLSLSGAGTSSNSALQCGSISATPSTCTIYTENLALTFRHPLLRGFGADIALAAVRKARIQKDVALLNRQLRAANVIRDVTTAYWELAYSTRELAINQSAVELARQQLRFTQAQIDVGRAAPLDAAAAQRAIADRQQQVVLSEQILYFRTLDLRRLLGVPSDATTTNYVAADVPDASPHETDAADEVKKALAANPQLLSMRLGLKITRVDLEAAAAALKPQLDFVGSLGAAGRNKDLPSSLEQTLGLDSVTWSAGLQFSMPIENRTATGMHEQTRLADALAQLNIVDYEMLVRDSVLRMSAGIASASKRVQLSREQVGYAGKNLEAEQARFNVGRSTSNEILLRQQELKTAEIQVVRAIVDLLNSEIQLGAMTGELLDRYGITLKGVPAQ